MKCLPQSKLRAANGTVLHDWHAEVLAIRALNHFILQECKAVLAAAAAAVEGDHPYASPYIRLRMKKDVDNDDDGSHPPPPFVWREDVTLHMYCSEAPCGDASMELTIAAQEDASPWEFPLPPHLLQRTMTTTTTSLTDNTPTTTSSSSASSSAVAEIASSPSPSSVGVAATPPPPPPDVLLLGRACFARLGVVRRKPARPDAPPTLSKSCSDKLALRQCTSLLGGLASLLVAPTGGLYLRSLVVPRAQYSAAGCARCFSARGRMKRLVTASASASASASCSTTTTSDSPLLVDDVDDEERRGGGGGRGDDDYDCDYYAFRPFDIATTALEFPFSRRGGGGGDDDGGDGGDGGDVKYVASSLATAWSANGLAENIIGGVLQGRRQTDPRGASQVSRARMWALARDVGEMAAAKDRGCGDDHVVAAVAAAAVAVVPGSGTYREVKGSLALRRRRRAKARAVRDALTGWVRNAGDDGFRLS